MSKSDTFGLEINGEMQSLKQCPKCKRDFIGGASDEFCGSNVCLMYATACRCPTDWCRLEPDNGAEYCPDLGPDEFCGQRAPL